MRKKCLLITIAGTIKHAALYIDKNLYFEKTRTDDRFAYGLIPFSVIQEMYPEIYQKMDFYRLKQDAQENRRHFVIAVEAV
jgi:hypothetical protein